MTDPLQSKHQVSRRASVARCRLTRKLAGNSLVAQNGRNCSVFEGVSVAFCASGEAWTPSLHAFLHERAGDLVVAALSRLAAPPNTPGCGVQGRLLRDGERAAALLFLPSYAQPHSDVTNTKRNGSIDRRAPVSRPRGRSAPASRPRRAINQICGRRLMRVKRRASFTCRDGCWRKEPLRSDQGFGLSARTPFGADSESWQGQFQGQSWGQSPAV